MQDPRKPEGADPAATPGEPAASADNMKRKSLPQLIVKRLGIVGFAVSITAASLYIAGNFQSFLADTQLFLLEALRWSSLFLIGLSAAGLALSAGRLAKHRLRRGGPGFAAYTLLLAWSAAAAIASTFVLVAAQR